MQKAFLACGFLLVAALFPACQNKPLKASQPGAGTAESAIVPATEPFAITISSGGGFTGLHAGFTLKSDGSIRHWEKRGAAGDSTLWAAQVPPDRILDFRKDLEQGGGLAVRHRETGNMTTLVKLELPDTLHLWSWPGNGVDESTPEPFRAWYPRLEAFCMALKDQSNQERK